MLRLAVLALALCAAVPAGGTKLVVGSQAAGQLRREQQPSIATIPKLIPVRGDKLPKNPVKEEPKEPKEEAKPEKEGGEHTGWAVAVVVFTGVTFASCLYAMTQTSRPHVANNTVMVLDNIVAIFLAVLWFQGFDDLTRYFPESHHRLLATQVHAGLLLLVMFAVAYNIRHKSTTIAIACGCGAHYCAFASGHWALTLQGHTFSDHPVWCFIGTFAVLADLIILGWILYHVKLKLGLRPGVETEDEGNNTFVDRFDDVECDFAGMAMALYWVMVVQFSIIGTYPDTDIDPGAKPDHNFGHRIAMLAYALAMFFGGPALIAYVDKGNMGYFKSRLVGLFKSFIAMSMAFGVLTCGKMSFYEHEEMNMAPIFARIVFAAVCSALAMFGIFYVAGHYEPGSASAACLTALGLIAGFAWEEVFDASVEDLVEETEYEKSGKAIVALVLAAVVMPTYFHFVKPKAMKAAEEEGG